LLPSIPKDDVFFFKCGHVIPNEQLLPINLSSGPTNFPFNFSFDKRNNEQLMTELALTLTNFANIVPGGIVVFFASYSYMNQVVDYWDKTGDLFGNLRFVKQII
jgi:chromosome transmission fidelity protein 1